MAIRFPTLLPLACLTLMCAALHAQATLRVPTQFPTIAAAIAAASTGDTVLIDPGTYSESGLSLAGKGLVLRSTGGAAVTTIDGGGAARILDVTSGEPAGTRVEGLRFTNGFGSNGGAILLASPGSSPSFLEIVDCVFDGNQSPSGGAVSQDVNTTMLVRGCVFDGNTASIDGGGMIIAGSIFALGPLPPSPTATIEGCRFVDNFASTTMGLGGGLFVVGDANVTVRSCLFAANRSLAGSGIAMRGGLSFGGPIPAPTVLVDHCTIAGNLQSIAVSVEEEAQCTLTNSIVRGNAVMPQIDGFSQSGSPSTLTIDNCNLQGLAPGSTSSFTVSATNVVDVDPMWTAPATGDYTLMRGSPMVDAGTTSPRASGIDAFGDPRNVNGDFLPGAQPDLGADELTYARLETSDANPAPLAAFDLTASVPANLGVIAGVVFASPDPDQVSSVYPAFGELLLAPMPLLSFDLVLGGGPTTFVNPGGAFGAEVAFQAFVLVEDTGSLQRAQVLTNVVTITLR
jgi:hypothetical protein